MLHHAAPATQNETEVLQVLHHATRKQAAPIVFNRRWTSADLSGGAPRAAPATQNDTEPATQNETEMLQVLRLPPKMRLSLPRKMRLRCSEICTCHAKAAGAHSTQSSPDFRGPLLEVLQELDLPRKNDTEMLRVLHLPRKMRLRCSKMLHLPRKNRRRP